MLIATPDVDLASNRISSETRLVLFIGLSISLHILVIYTVHWHPVKYPAKPELNPPIEVTILQRQTLSPIKQTEPPPELAQKIVKLNTSSQKQKQEQIAQSIETTKKTVSDNPVPGIEEITIEKPEQDKKKNQVPEQKLNATTLILQGIQFARGQQPLDKQKKAQREFSVPPADPRLVDKTNSTQREFQSYKNQNGNSVISRKNLFGIDMCLELKEADLNDPVAINMLYFAPC